MQFIAAGGAFLASCSGGGSVVTPGNRAVNPAPTIDSLRIRPVGSATTALGHEGFQLSTNQASTAVAMHTTAGEFMASFAVTSTFVRTTDATGKQSIIPRNLQMKHGWYVLDNGSKFKMKKLKSGAPALLGVDSSGQKKLLSFSGKHLFIRDQKTRTTQKIALVVAPGSSASVAAAARASLPSMIDNPGKWTGDENFAAVAQRTAPLGSIVSTPGRHAGSARRSTQRWYNPGTYGDGGNYGDAGDGYVANPNPTPTPNPAICELDYEFLIAAYTAYNVALAALTVCSNPVICAIAYAAYLAASAALQAAQQRYTADNCN